MIVCDWLVDIVDSQRLKKSNMNDSWFFDENFNGVSDEFFDDVIKHLDFPLEDLEPSEDWNSKFQSIEPPLGILSDLSTDFSKPQVPKNIAASYNRAPQLKAQSSTADTPSSGSALLRSDSNDGKDSQRFQSSSPVSVLGSSSSCSAENSAPVINPKLVFPVKRTRSKRQRPSTFKPQFVFPFFASESELESPLTEKPRRKKQKLKKNLTVLSGTRETKKPYFEPSGVTRKCTHCEVTETPQWREGPLGPKTLCNACGVRYRSGRLLPEYRPAASPTFIASVHSNSHKRILEMRNKVRQ